MSSDKKGRGSVSRSFVYERRWKDEEFRKNSIERNKKSRLKRNKKINNRCKDCNKLISPSSLRCQKCSIKYIRKKYLKK